MSRSVVDVFRETRQAYLAAGQARLAALIERLPTDEDRRRFLEAARIFLSFDRETRSLPAARRKALLNAPIEDTGQEANIAAALWLASERLLREDRPGDGDSELDLQLFGTRVLMAGLIVGGLRGTSDRKALMNAALRLHELGAGAELARSTIGGRSGRRDALSDSSAQHRARLDRLKTEAEKVKKERPHLRSKRDRANILNKRFKQYGWGEWPTRHALIEYARRNSIKI